jgi:hypothetical protein
VEKAGASDVEVATPLVVAEAGSWLLEAAAEVGEAEATEEACDASEEAAGGTSEGTIEEAGAETDCEGAGAAELLGPG